MHAQIDNVKRWSLNDPKVVQTAPLSRQLSTRKNFEEFLKIRQRPPRDAKSGIPRRLRNFFRRGKKNTISIRTAVLPRERAETAN